MKNRFRRSKLFITALSLVLFSQGFAANITVPNPGNGNDIQPAIQTAVNGAVNGDVIILPAGTFVLNKCVLITKLLSIKGQGKTQTILYRASSVSDNTLSNDSTWNCMFKYLIYSTTASNIVISDIYLKSKQPSKVSGDGLSRAADIGIKMVQCRNFVITRCRFDYFGNGAVSIYHDDNTVGGLIYNNEFRHNVKGEDGLGLGYGVVIYGQNLVWKATPQFGTANFIFVEDNYFDYHRHSIAAGGSALYVFRYNTVINNVAGNTAHAIDAHEARLNGLGGENHFATRAIEVYKNRIINTVFKDGDGTGPGNPPDSTTIVPGYSVSRLVEACIRPRGGEALSHHNYIKGYRFGVGPITGGSLGSTYPYPYQTGYTSGVQYGSGHTGVSGNRGAGDLFAWADTFDLYDPSSSANVYFYNYTPSLLVAERDYHFYAKGGYATYTYPHPLRSIIPAPVVVISDEPGISNAVAFSVLPNPNNGVFAVQIRASKGDNQTIVVYNAAGKKVLQKKLNAFTGESTTSMDLSKFGKGIYFVSISGIKTLMKKIVVQ